MSNHPKHVVEPLVAGERVVSSGAAIWRENPYAESGEDARGVLYVTNMRILFETEQVKPFVSLPFGSFASAELTDRRRGSLVQLLLVHIEGERKTFWVGQKLGEQVVQAVRTNETSDWPPPSRSHV